MTTTRYKFIFKQTWYSICSMHGEFNKDCIRCNIGSWKNNILLWISTLIFMKFFRLWRWHVNKYRTKFTKLK